MKDPAKLWNDVVIRFSKQSRCQRTHVGCIIVKDDFMIGEGWNSPPKNQVPQACERCKDPELKSGERLQDGVCVHAEANAIGHCAKHGRATQGADIYCTHFCCKYCADLIISAGIKNFYYLKEYPGWEEVFHKLTLGNVSAKRMEV
jgi:dCMP deaminase